MNIEKAKEFILATGRPIEQAQFRCVYEGGPASAVTEALLPFQNPDGGFGHGLEADNWNPNSTPITTNTALEILFHTGALDLDGEMARGMAGYLKSAAQKDTGLWPAVIDSNKDYPHAIWWEKGEFPIWNPGISLAAFLVCMGEDSYRETVQRAFTELETVKDSGDGVKCFMLAFGLLKKFGPKGVIDLNRAYETLRGIVEKAVCKDTSKYGVEYCTLPSWFPKEFVPESLLPQVRAEMELLNGQQLPDGGFDITWKWYTPYEEEFETARSWWRPRVTMEKLLFHKAWAAALSE